MLSTGVFLLVSFSVTWARLLSVGVDRSDVSMPVCSLSLSMETLVCFCRADILVPVIVKSNS